MSNTFIRSILKLIAEHELWDGDIFWDESLNFTVLCNDAFYWGSADAEELTQDSFNDLEKSIVDAGDDGCLLYCARRRGMRPQGAMYEYLDKNSWTLFDACGPEREVGIGNPKEHPLPSPPLNEEQG
jgi:hypothetical protein